MAAGPFAGAAILVYRRRTVGPVFSATTRNDKAMYVVLGSVIVLGLWATVRANIAGNGYDSGGASSAPRTASASFCVR